MSGFGWSAEEFPGDPSPWRFVLFDVRCKCGWFLAKAAPVMGRNGVHDVEGDCKRHGHVTAESWNIIDRADLA
jgi:hypothetical protein